MSIIIVGFQGIGKTYMANMENSFKLAGDRTITEVNEYQYHYYPSGLINPHFPSNYAMAIDQAKLHYDIVLLGFSNATMSSLKRRGVNDYIVVYPTSFANEEYANRYKAYIRNPDKIKYYNKEFASTIDNIENLDVFKYKLTIKQYLSDVILDVIDTYNTKKLCDISNSISTKRRDSNAGKKKVQKSSTGSTQRSGK